MPRKTLTSKDGRRICSKCSIPKDKDQYYKTDRTSDGCQSVCLECCAKYAKEKNASKPKKPKKEPQTKEEKNAKRRDYEKRRKAELSEEELQAEKDVAKLYREANKETNKEYKRLYHQENKEELNAISRQYRIDHMEERKLYLVDYLPRIRELRKERHQNDRMYQLATNLRSGVYRAFQCKGWTKTGKSAELLGCDLETAKKHIEKQFKKGMNWDNYGTGEGKWVIDHKIPLASAKNEDDLRYLCHYRNLQPLWEKENLVKNATIIPTQTHLPL